MLLTIIVFIVILGILIFVHELGHFVVAKKNGVRVDEFGFGFPPRVFGIKRGETVYSINAIPLGGFVKIYGEEGEGEGSERSFASKKVWRRTSILLAGVFMNFLLAIILFGLANFIGQPTALSDQEALSHSNVKVTITNVVQGSPAELSGVRLGDEITGFVDAKGQKIDSIKNASQFQQLIEQANGQKITLVLARGVSSEQIEVTPRLNPPAGQGALGIELANTAVIRYPWYRALWQGFLDTVGLIWMIVVILYEIIKNLIISGKAGVDVGGPVYIYNITSQFTQLGFVYLVRLTALLSANLAVINILPIPALDGGRILFLIFEKIKGSPISQKAQNIAHSIGFALLILLMLFITYKDILRLIK